MPEISEVRDNYKLKKDNFFTVLLTLLQYITTMIQFDSADDILSIAVFISIFL